MRYQLAKATALAAVLALTTTSWSFAGQPSQPFPPPSNGFLSLQTPNVDNGDDATTQWRIPDNALTPATLEVASAVEQVINEWSQAVDSQDPTAVANLFTSDGRIGLYYINQTTTPWTLSPTGYSPSTTPTGGTAGAGCTAVGQRAIAYYVRGTGLAKGYKWPSLGESETVLLDTRVTYDPSNPMVAYSHSYQNSLQNFATYRYEPGAGWKISELKLVYTTASPTLPCQN